MIQLSDYPEILEDLGERPAELLEASWQEAVRVFSPRGLQHYYLEGAASLQALGKGSDLVVSFIQNAPGLARELGEEAVADLLAAAIKMYSKTSSAILALLFSTSPVAARRLGDIELFRAYLHLIDQLLAQAPRGIRPMLEKLDVLLAQLTLGGLRRWALWGAQAHKVDFEGQQQYFSLQSPVSQKVLQQERKGTLFIDVQRRIGIYLRALWGRDFFMRPTSGDFEQREGYRPYIEGFVIFLPDAYDDDPAISGIELYRAAAAHAACHVVYTKAQFDQEGLNSLQTTLIGLIEDARIETLAIRKFPGLLQLWSPLHRADSEAGETAGILMARLARALIDADYVDNHPWVISGRDQFNQRLERIESAEFSRELGLQLAAEFSALNIPYSAATDIPPIVYRDDNRYIWEFENQLEAAQALTGMSVGQLRKYVSVMEMVNAIDVPGAGDDAEEIWVLPTEFYRDEETVSVNQQEGREPPPQPYHYSEWDYQMQLERPAWATVLEKRPKSGELEQIEQIVTKHKPIVSRLKFLIEAMQPQGVQRLRQQEDGDEIDINAAVRAMIEIRNGEMPDPRIMLRHVRKLRDLSVLLLIDLSESTNDTVLGSDSTILELAREATVLLADALDKIGDPFAIHGFDSNGRHEVEYFRYKDFGQPYNELAKSRLAGMSGQLSTRMGAAMRHAGSFLKKQPSKKKLLLVVSDGEPADNDVRDPQYLRQDARKAVEELSRDGIQTYCLTLDPQADEYVSRIFGAKRYMVLDRVERLPEKLPMLYAGLTR